MLKPTIDHPQFEDMWHVWYKSSALGGLPSKLSDVHLDETNPRTWNIQPGDTPFTILSGHVAVRSLEILQRLRLHASSYPPYISSITSIYPEIDGECPQSEQKSPSPAWLKEHCARKWLLMERTAQASGSSWRIGWISLAALKDWWAHPTSHKAAKQK